MVVRQLRPAQLAGLEMLRERLLRASYDRHHGVVVYHVDNLIVDEVEQRYVPDLPARKAQRAVRCGLREPDGAPSSRPCARSSARSTGCYSIVPRSTASPTASRAARHRASPAAPSWFRASAGDRAERHRTSPSNGHDPSCRCPATDRPVLKGQRDGAIRRREVFQLDVRDVSHRTLRSAKIRRMSRAFGRILLMADEPRGRRCT